MTLRLQLQATVCCFSALWLLASARSCSYARNVFSYMSVNGQSTAPSGRIFDQLLVMAGMKTCVCESCFLIILNCSQHCDAVVSVLSCQLNTAFLIGWHPSLSAWYTNLSEEPTCIYIYSQFTPAAAKEEEEGKSERNARSQWYYCLSRFQCPKCWHALNGILLLSYAGMKWSENFC